MATAESRAFAVLSRVTPNPASHIAGFIWPDHQMKAQGAGAAASRILKVLERKGQACWVNRDGKWGWVRTKGDFKS
jgi:hypothetical protein